jgi:hypothetical protein
MRRQATTYGLPDRPVKTRAVAAGSRGCAHAMTLMNSFHGGLGEPSHNWAIRSIARRRSLSSGNSQARGLCLLARGFEQPRNDYWQKTKRDRGDHGRAVFRDSLRAADTPFDNFAERCFSPRRLAMLAQLPWQAAMGGCHRRLLCASETTMVLVISGVIRKGPQSRGGNSCGCPGHVGDSPAAGENHLRRITEHPPGRCLCTRPGDRGAGKNGPSRARAA